MALNSEKIYVVGDPIEYSSVYGYAKRRFPIYEADENGKRTSSCSVGEAKEEPMLDENGKLWGRCFYTKNLGRPSGKYRFYPSVEALIVACGGQVLNKPAAEHPVSVDEVKAIETSTGDAPVKPSSFEARLLALENKVFLGPTRRGTPKTGRKPAKGKSVSKMTAARKRPAKKADKVYEPPKRQKKVSA